MFLPNTTVTVDFDLSFTPNGPAQHLSGDVQHLTIGTYKVLVVTDGIDVPSSLSGTATLDGVPLDMVITADFGRVQQKTLIISN
jgi:hypothetical protein